MGVNGSGLEAAVGLGGGQKVYIFGALRKVGEVRLG